ncbi:sugar ABC transporter substrate-binding protein [Skermanella mucosa]|uniref:sugar ABC transporter substrate-binding protein n=1 Tax=Skermanella mucosa TaxID=1789672 RepID=UPI00192AFF08|nr:sugar ABC transporter substrate-binding protein [Skermanella mucosa]UEM22945.1 sugar ABC transporter substrate-binding protein [Skermanella mucosa]
MGIAGTSAATTPYREPCPLLRAAARAMGGILVAVFATVWLAACDDPKPADKGSIADRKESAVKPADPVPERRRIALVMKTLTNPFFIEMERGARVAEAELGIELLVKTAAQETSIEQQVAIVEELIRQQVDAIVIAPGDSVKLIPVLKRAQAAGLAVVNIDNRLDAEFAQKVGMARVPFISVDNENGAYLAGMVLAENVSVPTKAAIIEGIRSAANAEARKAGALRAFAANPAITVVAQESADWKIDEAYDVAKSMFEREPGISLLFCANDMMALGAARYIQEAGRRDVRIAGYDALNDAVEAVKSGALVATIDQQAGRQGYLGVTYANRMLSREQVPLETMVEVRVITARPERP